jgi:hypothetical protein
MFGYWIDSGTYNVRQDQKGIWLTFALDCTSQNINFTNLSLDVYLDGQQIRFGTKKLEANQTVTFTSEAVKIDSMNCTLELVIKNPWDL